MATTGKPRTTFIVSYGSLGETVAQAALAPVLIAPRYSVIDRTDDAAVLGEFSFPASQELKVVAWPGHVEGASVDVASGELFVRNAVVQLNDEGIKATVAGNKITLAADESVKLGGAVALSEELQGAEVMVGDIVRVTDADNAISTAEIVDIRAEYVDPAATVSATTANVAKSGLVADASKFSGSEGASYLIRFVEDASENWETAGVGADVTSLAGDVGFKATIKMTKAGVKLSSTNVVVSLEAGAEAIKEGDAFIVKISPKSVKAYNEIYVNASLTAGSDVTVNFATGRLTNEYTPISTAAWDATESDITIADTVNVTVGSRSYLLVGGTICASYRELLTDGALQLFSSATDNVAEIVGVADPRNPMGMMYACASQVTGGFFYMIAPEADTDEAYIDAINYVGKYEQAYAIVPARQTSAVQAATKAVINKYSSKEVAKYKRAWFTPTTQKISAVYSVDATGSALIGAVTNNVLTLEGDADAITAGVRRGDIVRVYRGSSSTDNAFLYSDFTVGAVNDATSVTLVNAGSIGISRVEFLREQSAAEYAKALANEARSIASHRVNFVASDKVRWGAFDDVDLCYLAATVANVRCSLPPHAPMNEVVIPGFSSMNEYKWTDADYEEMNNGGVWLVYTNEADELVTYHQITTISDGTIAEEDSAVSNGDSIVRTLRLAVRPIASGKANVSNAILQLIDKVLRANIDYIMGIEYADIYGPQIQDYKIVSLYIPEGNRKSIRCKVQLQLPLPLQDGEFEFNLI